MKAIEVFGKNAWTIGQAEHLPPNWPGNPDFNRPQHKAHASSRLAPSEENDAAGALYTPG